MDVPKILSSNLFVSKKPTYFSGISSNQRPQWHRMTKKKWKYDIVCFESFYWSQSHYEYDIKNIADILCDIGYEVAVINYFKENIFHKDQRYDLINIFPKNEFPDREYVQAEKNKIKRFFKKIILDYKRYNFFNELFGKISHLSYNFYMGTLSLDSFPLFFLKHKNKKIYFWGIRSFYLSKPFVFLKSNPYHTIKSLFLKYMVKNRNKYFFFISNRFIKDEFKQIGINDKNLILRPERTIKKFPNDNLTVLSGRFTVSTIGFLREDKQIDFAIDALKETDITYIVAGKSKNEYAYKIDEQIRQVNKENIVRVNKFLPDDEYINLMQKTHFFLFCDRKQPSVVSNGTFLEALLKSRPVIAPDLRPYNYYIDKYKVGIKYKPDDKESLLSAISMAKEIGVESFISNIHDFQKNYLFEEVAAKVKGNIRL